MLSKLRRLAPVVFLALVIALGWAPSASAHAAYKDSDPGDESSISTAPSSVWAEFTEPLSDASSLTIFDPCGTQVDAGDVQISGYRMTVSMASDKRGEFTVRFVANSSLDGHTTNGDFTFAATDGKDCAGASEEQPTGDKPQRDQDTSDPSDDSAPADTSPASDEAASQTGDTNSKEDQDTARGNRSGGKNGTDRGGKKSAGIELALDNAPAPSKQPTLLGDMPWGAFGLALLFALLIGAAGGKVYAGIMGPRA